MIPRVKTPHRFTPHRQTGHRFQDGTTDMTALIPLGPVEGGDETKYLTSKVTP